MVDETPTENGANEGEPRGITVQKVYVKDASIEVPDAPRIFTEDYSPEVSVDLNTQIQTLSEQVYEVAVTVTVTATQAERTAYIVEVQQAGVFDIGTQAADNDTRGPILGAYCPSILFPYLREAAGDMVQRAGFPHFLLQPVNFDELYAQHQTELASQASAGQATH